MKKLLMATAFSLAVTQANATGVGETLMEPEVLVQETAAGSGGFIVPLLLLAIIAVVTTGGGTPGGPGGGGLPKGCLGPSLCPPIPGT